VKNLEDERYGIGGRADHDVWRFGFRSDTVLLNPKQWRRPWPVSLRSTPRSRRR